MKYVILVTGMFIFRTGYSQLVMKPVHQKVSTHKIQVTASEDIAQASLPFWDDFSISSLSPDSIRIWEADTTRQWNYEASKNVLINATLAKNPPTYQVATFDGLDAQGNFHGTEKGLTDQLVSDSIDLSAYNESDGIYLSFFWQAGGNVEIPDEGDSLVLQFYDPVAPQWQTIWLKDGEDVQSDSIFYQEIIKIKQQFLTNEFCFRFQSYGDQDGPFDAWHLDWIYLNEGRERDNYFYLDRGFTGQFTSPFSPFKTLPVHQFKANESAFTNSQTVQAFNLDQFIQPTEYIIVMRDLVSNAIIDSNLFGGEEPLLPNSNPLSITEERTILFEGMDLSSIPDKDSVFLQSELYIKSSDDNFLDGTQINLRINDTIRTEYLLHDFYAYDDGTAEYAVGTNIRGGQVGVQFWVEEKDTLSHIDIYFPNIDPSSSNNSITFRVYNNLEDPFPLHIQPVNIINGADINDFTRYTLNRPIVVTDTFYITYEQNVNEYIGIGFDRSNFAAAKYIFENMKGQWTRNSRLQGALMIRPVFRTIENFTLGTERRVSPLEIFPNPTSGSIKIKGSYQSIQIYTFHGQLLLNEKAAQQHHLTGLPTGLYLLTIQRKEGNQTKKIIKE